MKKHFIQGTVIVLSILAAFGIMELAKRHVAKVRAQQEHASELARKAAAAAATQEEAAEDLVSE